jgi:hypothetical protein
LSYLVAFRHYDLMVAKSTYFVAMRLTWCWRIKKFYRVGENLNPFIFPTYIYFKLFTFQYLPSDSILVICLLKFFLLLNLFILPFSYLVKFWYFSTFYL